MIKPMRDTFWALFTINASASCLITALWQVQHPDRTADRLIAAATGCVMFSLINARIATRLIYRLAPTQ